MLFYLAAGLADGAVSTICAGIMAVVGLMMVYRTAQPMNRLHIVLLAGLSTAVVVCFFFIKPLFNLVPLDFLSHLVLGVFALLAWPTFNVMERFVASLRQLFARARTKYHSLRSAED